MKILFLSRWFPFPPDNGARIRVYNLLLYLSRQHAVDMISFNEGPVKKDQLEGMKPAAKVLATFQYRKFSPGRLRSILGLFSMRPRSVIDTYRAEFMDAVKKAQASNLYDVVIANEIDMAPYALALKGPITILEELEVTSLYDAYLKETRPLARLRNGLTWLKLKHYTARLIRSFDGCTVVSELERATIQKLAPERKNIRVIPNGVDFAHFDDYPPTAREENSLVYSGALTYQANFDAVAYFMGDIYPKIKTQIPDVKFYVTGRTDGVPLERLPRRDEIIFSGYVSDIRSVLSRCCVNVVPLRMGGGTRLKILEALAMGTPVVSTAKGAEGLDLVAGQDLILADGPDEFAQAVIRLLKDAALRERLAANGKMAVMNQYDWRFIAQNLQDAIRDWSQKRNDRPGLEHSPRQASS